MSNVPANLPTQKDISVITGPTADIDQSIDLGGLIRRRWLLGIGTAIGFFALTGTVIALWPSTYRSTATILIQEPSVPDEMVKSTVTALASEQLQMLQTSIMSNQNLNTIIAQFDLYPGQRDSMPRSQLLDSMRDKIDMTLTNVDVTDPKSGRTDRLTVAFTLSFDSKSPETAQKVTNRLVELYLAENNKSREQSAALATRFLGTETEKLQGVVQQLENQLAVLRSKYAGNLPDQQPANTDLLNQLQAQLLDTQRQIQSQQQRRAYISSQLTQISPYQPPAPGQVNLNPASQLQALQVQYATMSAQYGANYPDVVNLRRQIEGLKASTGSSVDTSALRTELKKVTDDLNVDLQRYGASHPDVKRLRKQQASLQRQITTAGSGSGGLSSPAPDNPAYIQVQSSLGDATADLRGLQGQEAGLVQKIDDLLRMKAEAPEIEREYDGVKQQYDAAVQRYQTTKDKASDAKVAQNLENTQSGATYSLLEPATLPDAPVKPNRPLLLFFAGVLSLAAGTGGAVLSEMLDERVVTSRFIIRSFGASPLAVIPYVRPRAETLRRRRRLRLSVAAAVILLICSLGLVNTFVEPLSILFSQGTISQMSGSQPSSGGTK